MIVTFDKIHDTISIEFIEDKITKTYGSHDIPSNLLHNLMVKTNSVILAKVIETDGKITNSILVPEYNSQCYACMYQNTKGCNNLKCDGITFMKFPEGFIHKSKIKNHICNEDTCPYIENCDSAPLCLLKTLEK